MSDTVTNVQRLGTVGWPDLTVPNAEEVREFYKAVIGWESSPVRMGEYVSAPRLSAAELF